MMNSFRRRMARGRLRTSPAIVLLNFLALAWAIFGGLFAHPAITFPILLAILLTPYAVYFIRGKRDLPEED